MSEHSDKDPTLSPATDPPIDPALTRSYRPPNDLSSDERATELRLTGSPNDAANRRDEAPLTHAGRYVILREIGRGGMGVVLEAEDAQLHRRLAIKVLLQQHQHDPTLVRRFLDEARICAQLQHPGIVPIHEIGLLPDERPFFTMKLIQGRTLALLLQERRQAGEELPRLLAVFEQVCLTMAYAHSHGVLHRDLKPSNVMVGGFGEVQVMDWGLAKVLDSANRQPPSAIREEPEQTAESGERNAESGQRIADSGMRMAASEANTSLAGTVMGTPGFMAPEQARGSSEQIDARCDVFGLGGLLCVILTGKPPYDGATHPQVYRQAVEADLDGAYERLERCQTDAELVRLARSCLAVDPNDRPRDAGVVAEAITRYRASVSERLHAAEMERAAAQVRAVGERKARRLTLALATVFMALLLLGAGFWFWLERERQQERLRVVRDIEERLQQAVRLREKGKAASIGDLTPWDEALAAAQAAVEKMPDQEIDPALRQRAEDLLQKLQREARDRRMLAQLEEIRLTKSQSKNFDLQSSANEYAAAFRAYGIDVAILPVEQAAEAIRGRAIAAELAAALDDWASAAEDALAGKRLLETARQADVDAWRQRLRAALLEKDGDALADAARSAEVDHLPPTTLHLLGQALWEVRDPIESIRLLRRAQRLHPDDFWINFQLGLYLEVSKPSRPAEAVRFYSAALAVHKQSAGAHLSLAVALHDNHQLDEALDEYREALRLQKDFPLAHYNLGNALKDKRDPDAAIAEYRETVRLKPDYVEAWTNLGTLLGQLGRFDEAREALSKAVEIKPSHASAHHSLAQVLLRMQQLDEALAACRQAVHFQGNAIYYNTLGQLLEKNNQPAEAVDAYKKAIELNRDYAQPHRNLAHLYQRLGEGKAAQAEMSEAERLQPTDVAHWTRLGQAALKREDYRKAIDAWRKVTAINPKGAGGWLNLGTALGNDGQLEEAIAAYQQAVRLQPKFLAAWTNLGITYHQMGDLNAAIEAYQKAVEAAPKNAEMHNSLGTALAERGRLAEAARSFREAIRLRPDFARAHNNLGNALDAQGEFAEAIEAYDRAIGLNPDYVMARWNRGQTFLNWGKVDEAIAAIRDAVHADRKEPWSHCLLGIALQGRGRLRPAYDEFAEGHELGIRQKGWNKPSAQWLQDCRHQLDRDKKLTAFRRGTEKPANPEERLGVALLCLQVHPYYADSARLFRDTFTERPALAEKHRLQAACAAVLAGCGQGEENKLTDAERADWRKQALTWLRTDLESLKTRSERGSESLRGLVRKELRRWQYVPTLAAVRDAPALDKLPKEERESWRRLWDEVNRLLAATAPEKMRN